jgi:anti-sigma-K factor RskA
MPAQRHNTLVYPQGPGLEQRVSELQAQIEQLTLSLNLWRQKDDQAQPAEPRLLQLADRCAEVLDQWTGAGTRHAEALGQIETRLSGLDALETRVHHEAAERLRELQRAIEHEWGALRHLHEEPVRQLREQAASLAEVCVAAATSAQRSFERAESRLAALEADLHRRMTELSRDVHAVVDGRRSGSDQQPPALAEGGPQWPLEGVMRLHHQLRRASDVANAPPETLPRNGASTPPEMPARAAEEPRPSLSDRITSLETALGDRQADAGAATERRKSVGRTWIVALAAAAVLAVGFGVFVWQLQRQAGAAAARALDAEHQARLATDAAKEQLLAAREEASSQIAAARETARRAQMVSDVLAAPDVIRFSLAGGNSSDGRFFAQVLWSRSRGFVFSGSRLPAPPAGSTYQIWLATTGEPVSAGVFVPDTSGKITIATDSPPRIPRPVTDVMVTVEPGGGRSTPSGATVLARPAVRPATS